MIERKNGKIAEPIVSGIRAELSELNDPKYRELQIRLIPAVVPEAVIGVRTPAIRSMAGKLIRDKEICAFLNDLPHLYFEEDQLHAFIVSSIRDYPTCLEEVSRFLPYVNNWATCDQMSPKVFRKHRRELAEHIRKWLDSDRPYTVRFGIRMLMDHYLDEDFDPLYLKKVAGIRSEEYYVKMMIAWYFATALAKQYQSALPYLEDRLLDPWTHNKAIQKAEESYRISCDKKEYLKTLRTGRRK